MRAGLEILQRIDRLIIDAHFVVKVRPGRATGRSNLPQELPSLNQLTNRSGKRGKVTITRRETAAMIDNHELTITVLPAGECHGAVGAGNHWCAPLSLDVLAGVKLIGAPAKRIPPAPKPTLERTCDWPN